MRFPRRTLVAFREPPAAGGSAIRHVSAKLDALLRVDAVRESPTVYDATGSRFAALCAAQKAFPSDRIPSVPVPCECATEGSQARSNRSAVHSKLSGSIRPHLVKLSTNEDRGRPRDLPKRALISAPAAVPRENLRRRQRACLELPFDAQTVARAAARKSRPRGAAGSRPGSRRSIRRLQCDPLNLPGETEPPLSEAHADDREWIAFGALAGPGFYLAIPWERQHSDQPRLNAPRRRICGSRRWPRCSLTLTAGLNIGFAVGNASTTRGRLSNIATR